ncbi:MAG: ATP synthase F1 subunit gamma [Anaerolineae bacterium]|nr:ATP synthase F1 subunit gamma [Anaerolineae bacterium]
MAGVREIKRRIQSVKNISKVTRALEAVSASKARRAQQRAERSRAYAQAAWEILVNLSGQPGTSDHPLLANPTETRQVDIVLITSDRGLAGSYNLNIIRRAEEFAAQMDVPVRWVTIGRKGRDYLLRRRYNVVAEFTQLSDEMRLRDLAPIGELLVSDFLGGVSQEIFIAYTDFINTLTQRPAVMELLPLSPYSEDRVGSEFIKKEPPQTIINREYVYEPSANAILDEIVPRFVTLNLYQAALEARASEHAARMVAMRNASDNAGVLVEGLTLEYNKARQLAITSEILDIVGGVEALKGQEAPSQNNGRIRLT